MPAAKESISTPSVCCALPTDPKMCMRCGEQSTYILLNPAVQQCHRCRVAKIAGASNNGTETQCTRLDGRLPDGRTDGSGPDGRTAGKTDGSGLDGITDPRIDVVMDGRTDVVMDGRTDGRMAGRMEGSTLGGSPVKSAFARSQAIRAMLL